MTTSASGTSVRGWYDDCGDNSISDVDYSAKSIFICCSDFFAAMALSGWLPARGDNPHISRLGFGLLFAICGGILGYFIGSMIP
jgi:hypothetical protein